MKTDDRQLRSQAIEKRLFRRSVRDVKSKLRIGLTGRDLVMSDGIDSWRETQNVRGVTSLRRCIEDLRDLFNFQEVIDHDLRDAAFQRKADLLLGLVVAVHVAMRRRHAGSN